MVTPWEGRSRTLSGPASRRRNESADRGEIMTRLIVGLFSIIVWTAVGVAIGDGGPGPAGPVSSEPADRHRAPREISFDERVAAQRAIERVYWAHRTWPDENGGAKPALSEVLSDASIRAKVED